MKASKAPSFNFPNLILAEESGQLAARMSAELERHLLLGPTRLRQRDVVTSEPEPSEERVYGDATHLIVEWRLRGLEIGLIEDHELTRPRPRIPGTALTGGDGSGRANRRWRGQGASGQG